MKKWYLSKTLWVNFLAFVAGAIQTITGHLIFNPAEQIVALTIINTVLRLVTNTGLIDDSKKGL
ncbi:MAG: hypothetical protein WC677_02670 [Clostridia bacterium]|jgi:hypothetical protein